MAISGTDIVKQLRGRMRFYHVGDPVRRDMGAACEVITKLLEVQLRETHTAASVRGWLLERTDPELKREIGVKLTPSQRRRLQVLEKMALME